MKSDKLFLWSLGVLLCGLLGGIAHAEMQSSSSVDLPSCWCESCHSMVQCTNLEASNRTAPASFSKPSSAGTATEASQ
jgi:hypothetical protein